MFRSNSNIPGSVLLVASVIFLAIPALAAHGDFYTSYQQAKVVAHLALSGTPTQMFLQQQGRKEYLYVQQRGQKGFTVINVSRPKRPSVVSNVPRENIAVLGPGLAITEEPQTNSCQDSANCAGSGVTTAPLSVKVLDVSDPSHPRTVETFTGVTSIVTDDARGLVYVANREGIWVLSHQQYLRRHLCGSSDAISSAEPNCD